jgi:hypothetical protein
VLVRDELTAVEAGIAALTAESVRARLEKRSPATPTTIEARNLGAYARGLRRAIKADVPVANDRSSSSKSSPTDQTHLPSQRHRFRSVELGKAAWDKGQRATIGGRRA